MTDYNTPAPIGHNVPPPEDMNETAKREIDAALVKVEARLVVLKQSAERAKATTRDEAGKVTDLVGMFATLEGALNRAHSEVKAPYLDAGRVIDGRAAGIREQIDERRKAMLQLVEDYQTAEAKKIADLREAERAAEAADPEPTAATVTHAEVDRKRVEIRGDYGASAKLVDHTIVTAVDVKKLPKRFLERPDIRALIEKEALKLHKAGEPVNGVTYGTATGSRVRKGG